MPQPAALRPDAFDLPGGEVGVLLLHGYTGSPPEMRLVGGYLNERGLTVVGPLLPGHGTTIEDINTCRWQDWLETAEAALAALERRCPVVFVGGLSMGSLLTLYLAARHPELAGAMAYSPAVLVRDRKIYLSPLIKYFVKSVAKPANPDGLPPLDSVWSYDRDPVAAAAEVMKLQGEARAALPRIRCPLLVIYSTNDRTIAPTAGNYTYLHAGTADKQVRVLERSGHVITADSEWQTVAAWTYEFVERHSNPRTPR